MMMLLHRKRERGRREGQGWLDAVKQNEHTASRWKELKEKWGGDEKGKTAVNCSSNNTLKL